MIFANTITLLALKAPVAFGLPSAIDDRAIFPTTANVNIPLIETQRRLITVLTISSQYDDIQANPLLNTGMTTTPPSPYKGLCYDNVGVGNYSLNLVGFMPKSRPNALYSAPEETLFQPAEISTTRCSAGGMPSDSISGGLMG